MAQPYPSSDLALFTVRRQKPELMSPAKPTPHELKLLSDIDDQYTLRSTIPVTFFYRSEPSMAGKDPVKVIREALAKALVFYYPFAGRLKEGEGGKIMVDCNEEGVMFIEADADVTLQRIGDDLQPPFPCLEDLLYSPPGSYEILHFPILLIQVTRLKCGGFIFGCRINHTMADAFGYLQFFEAIAEMAKGATEPSIQPVWKREVLSARDPPHVTCTHHEYDDDDDEEEEIDDIPATDDIIVHRSFFFGPTEVSSLRRLLPDHLRRSTSSSDLVTAGIWRCRTEALQIDPHKHVRMMIVVNTRSGDNRLNPPLPEGYYGNAFVFPTAISSAGKLCESPLGYAVELVRKAKAQVNDEYVHSVADMLATRRRTPCCGNLTSCFVSDVSRVGLRDIDFGWGKALFAGPAKGGLGTFKGATFHIGHRSSKGEEGRVVLICLPSLECMHRFAKELYRLLNGVPKQIQESTRSSANKSKL